jgi:hypothetical protein
MQRKGSRLSAALVVERDIGLPLKTPTGVPGGAPVTGADQFHAGSLATTRGVS